jgi:hypothetical protein
MPTGQRAIRIPKDLGVIMSVQVDKARCNDTTRGVQNAIGGLPLQTADLGDFAVFDPDVTDIPWRASPINIVPPVMRIS